jgi:glycosyltransferase involved in cell wall biosynthesis
MKNPKVTVLMSVYNGEKYLQESIDSILEQTFRDFEFVIVNDGSIDKTAEILKSYKDVRIKIVNNEKNIGLTKSLNKGLKIAKGEYIARMDADDISMSERLEKEIEFLESHQEHAVVGTFVKIMNENSEIIRLWDRPTKDIEIREFLKRDNCIVHGSVMIRKSSLHDVGFYDKFMVRSQDYDLWLKLSEKYYLANIPEYLYFRREHNDIIGMKYREEQLKYVEIAKSNALERQCANLLEKVKNHCIDIRKATRLFINVTIEKNMRLRENALEPILCFKRLKTFKKIVLFCSYRFLVWILFSKKINRIMRDFKIEKINLEKAESDLKKIVNRRLI